MGNKELTSTCGPKQIIDRCIKVIHRNSAQCSGNNDDVIQIQTAAQEKVKI